MASREMPNANAMPSVPMASPAITAEPTPPKTSTKVPRASAMARRCGMTASPFDGPAWRPILSAPGTPVSRRTGVRARLALGLDALALAVDLGRRGPGPQRVEPRRGARVLVGVGLQLRVPLRQPDRQRDR